MSSHVLCEECINDTYCTLCDSCLICYGRIISTQQIKIIQQQQIIDELTLQVNGTTALLEKSIKQNQKLTQTLKKASKGKAQQ